MRTFLNAQDLVPPLGLLYCKALEQAQIEQDTGALFLSNLFIISF